MAPTKVFLTGATGYIGGEAFFSIYKAHPDWEYTLMVRSDARAAPVKAKYPAVRIVIGSLNDAEVIEKEAAAADIVIHTAESADDLPSATAIAKGLAAGHTPENPGYWIHISGTGILQWYDQANNRWGQPPIPTESYHDINDISRILTLPDSAIHRDIDKIVLAANSESVRTAIIAPPTIYGPGRGPVNTRSLQGPDMAKFTLEMGFAPIQDTGKTAWSNVHIRDLGRLFVLLADATQDSELARNPDVVGERAYYFVVAGHHTWGELATNIADWAFKLGYLPAPLVKTSSKAEVQLHGGPTGTTWGWNSVSYSERAEKYLGWAPEEESLEDTLEELVKSEAEKLKMEPREKGA